MEYHANRRNSGKAILIFPGGMPRSLEFLERCLRENQAVIGASSLDYDVARERYPVWLRLPFVTAPEFGTALAQAIRELNIGGVYSPNPVVWSYLNRNLQEIAPGIPLVNDTIANVELSGYRAALNRARATCSERPFGLASSISARPGISEIELAALFRHADCIPGMCDHEKVRALIEIGRYCAAGDVVEIGSWWGKSAFILLRLAQIYGIGKVLCVDPWSDASLIQNDRNGLVDTASAQFSADEAFDVFKLNLLPYGAGDINYLRMPSTDGAAFYRAKQVVESEEFGKTDYSGHIALLHIDGNHRYENVRADIEAWSVLVVDKGWIVIDDYTWPFGDGPRRAGDELLAASGDRISCAFFMGGALFIQAGRGAG